MAAKKKKTEEIAKIENFTWDMLSDVFGDDCVVGEASPDIKGYLHTGCRTLDWAFADREFRGGYPSGRMVEFFGDEGCGKTSMVTHALISAQKGNGVLLDWTRENGKLIGRPSATRKMKPGLAILIDSECKYPIERAQNMGLDVDQLVRIVKDDGEPMSFEDCIEAIENTLDRISKITYFDTPEAPVCVVLDSLAQSPIEAEMEGNGLQDGIAAKARKIRMAMRRMTQKLSRMHVYMLFTNHQYARIGAPGSEASGGRGLKLAASLRLAIKKGYPDGQLNASGGEQIGVNSTVTTVKSSVCVPPTPVTVPIVWRTGISPAFEMIKALTDNPEFNSPMIKKGGGGRVELIKPDGELVKPYVYQLVQELEANPELMSYVESLFDACIRRSV